MPAIPSVSQADNNTILITPGGALTGGGYNVYVNGSLIAFVPYDDDPLICSVIGGWPLTGDEITATA